MTIPYGEAALVSPAALPPLVAPAPEKVQFGTNSKNAETTGFGLRFDHTLEVAIIEVSHRHGATALTSATE
jgi:hypothetical protein